MQTFIYRSTPTLICEAGSLRYVSDLCGHLKINHPLLVTDKTNLTTGFQEKLMAMLDQAGLAYSLCADDRDMVSEDDIYSALKQARTDEVDGVIGLGSESALDTAKLTALLAGSNETLAEVHGDDQASGPRLPLILIPTTAGNGVEATNVASFYHEPKIVTVMARHLYPDVVLLDAELTLATPPRETALYGLHGMVNAIEAYTNRHRKNAYTDMLAREALQLLAGNLETATFHGHQLESRQQMQLGACLAGQALANSPAGAALALALTITERYNITVNMALAPLLPPVLEFNSTHAENLYAELACLVVDAEKLAHTPSARCAQFIDYFYNLIQRLELPQKLQEAGMTESDLSLLANLSQKKQKMLDNNPRAVSESDALAIYRDAF